MYDGIYKHSILHTYFITNDAFFHTCVLLRTLAVYDAFRHYVRCTMMSCLSIGFAYIPNIYVMYEYRNYRSCTSYVYKIQYLIRI